MNRRWAVTPLALLIAACGGPATGSDASVAAADAFSGADADAVDGGADPSITWSMGPALPVPLAYSSALILTVGLDEYVYVFGGSSAGRSTLGAVSSAVYRSLISASDDSLGPWESMGDITVGTTARGLVGHGTILISDNMGHQGVAFAGGGSATSPLPIVLAVYVDDAGALFDWSRFPPMLTQGQSFGTFDQFEAYRLALVGGLTGSTYSDQVRIAATDNGSTETTWAIGPHLPAPRARHASFKFANRIYLLGGENLDGPVADVLRTTRDAGGAIDGWETVGTIDGAPLGEAAFTHARFAWLVGGVEGGLFDGHASARVRRARFGTDGHLGAFEDADPMPTELAGAGFATTGRAVYLAGGQSGPDLTAVSSVWVGRLR